MANKKISQLAGAGALSGAELVPVVQGGVTKAATVAAILASAAAPYDVAGGALGVPGASAIIARFDAVRAFSFPVALANSRATAGTPATGATVFSLRKNGVEFGTLTFAASATIATFAAALATTFAPGDILTVVAPASADATLADMAFTLAGSLA